MVDTESTVEIESDIEICVVDDDDGSTKEIVNFNSQIRDDENFGQTISEDNYYTQTPLPDITDRMKDASGEDESERGDEEIMNNKEAVPSFSETDSVSKGIPRGGQNGLSLENCLENDNPEMTQNVDSCSNFDKEHHGIKRDNSSCDSDDNDDDDEDDEDDEDDDDNDDDGGSIFRRFYFESDHLAFKHNRDYKNLLKTLVILEAERMKSVKDLEELQLWKEKALKDPISFVESLRSKNPPKLPERKQIPVIPTVDWLQYLTPTDMVDFAEAFKVKTRRSIRTKGERDKQIDSTKTVDGLDRESNTFESTIDQGKIITSRVDENKAMSFNRLWTNEEQEKLEKLLQIYPPEEVEARRWEKIARALGNRTPKQVSSRVQKYFIKLARAGLPIPGRVPHLTTQRKTKMNPVSYRNSTFFPSWKPSIYMNEDDEDETSSVATVQSDSSPYLSDEDMIPSDLKESAEYKELLHLKRVKRDVVEAKTQCGLCGIKQIKGPQYRCADCPDDQSFTLCKQCMERNRQQPSSTHPVWHHMVLVGKSSSFVDGDYMSFELQNGKYNYLDPNFTPNVR